MTDEVVDCLAGPVRVDVGVRPGPDIDPGDVGRGQAGTGELGAVPEQGSDIGPLQPEAEPVLVAPGQQQQVIGEPGQPFGFRLGVADRGGQLPMAAARPRRELKFPLQRRRGGAAGQASATRARWLASARCSRPSRSFIVQARAASSSRVDGTRLPQPQAQLESVPSRQHDVEDDRPVGILRSQPQAPRAVGGDVHRVAFLP